MENKDLLINISKLTDTANRKIKELLNEQYPYLWFFISDFKGEISLWVRVNGHDGMSIELPRKLYVGNLRYTDIEALEKLNAKVKPVSLEPDKYFYCTECGEVKQVTELQDSVFAGYYCKECAKKPEISNLIKASYEKGFYD